MLWMLLMSRRLVKRHAGSPLVTNAAHNRNMAMRCFQVGMTPAQIAAEWPEVWKLTDGKLGQKYDYELGDGSGRFETNRMITSTSVDTAIARHAQSPEYAALRARLAELERADANDPTSAEYEEWRALSARLQGAR